MDITQALKEEIEVLKERALKEITDPVQKAKLAEMTADFAMLPIRMARGEDITLLAASLKAELAARGVASTMKLSAMAQQAWMNIVVKVLTKVILAL